MRIISGCRRGTKLFSPIGMHTRPTGDRVKEGLFSSLQFGIRDTLVLDGFAGSGALGLEALSRGARKTIFVENDSSAYQTVEKNIRKTGFENQSVLIRGDLIQWLSSYKGEPFDLVFLDPPYGEGMADGVIDLLVQRSLLTKQGLIVLETARETCCKEYSGTVVIKKQANYGKTMVCFYGLPDRED